MQIAWMGKENVQAPGRGGKNEKKNRALTTKEIHGLSPTLA